jgi:predicted transcriptional regulator
MSNTRKSGISEEVKKFIFERIDSVELLEVLLLLHRNPNQTWSAVEISEELRTSPRSAEKRLTSLIKSNLIVQTHQSGYYQFSPRLFEDRILIDDLAKTYHERKYTVIELIFSKPIDIIQTFADAFKFKKDKENG